MLEMTKKEKTILRKAIREVEKSIKNRHINSAEWELNATLYSLQDYLGGISVEMNNKISFPK